jgi:hypothetical protein
MCHRWICLVIHKINGQQQLCAELGVRILWAQFVWAFCTVLLLVLALLVVFSKGCPERISWWELESSQAYQIEDIAYRRWIPVLSHLLLTILVPLSLPALISHS